MAVEVVAVEAEGEVVVEAEEEALVVVGVAEEEVVVVECQSVVEEEE